ncbi:tetratricopeptide repeat protein [Candidatus Daviesbacteria bacterium]|nr:tetratricopeptide repeat protein [Candidatus Daviesbacteria bacterium]
MLAALHLYLIEKKMYSYIFAILAFFSYEPALVLIPLLVTYDVLIKKIPLRETLSNIKKYLPYLLAGLSFIFIRLVLIGRNPAHFKYLADSFYHTQLIMTKVFVKYLSLLIAPFNLSLNHIIDPDFETFNPPVNDFKSFTSQSILDPWVITSILIIATLIFITIKFRNKLPLVSFGLAWIFISFLPYANLVPQPTPLAERYLYIASFGFCLLLGYLLVEISNFKFQISNYFLFTLFFLLFSFYFYQTYQRNKDWKEKGSLWQRALVYYPNSAFASYIMARVNQEKGNLPEAIKFYNQTANLQPGYVTAYLELGRLYHKNNQLDKALEVLVKATQLELEPIDENRLDASIGELAKVYTEIGFIYREKKKFKEAYTNFEQALSLYSGYLPAKVSIETLLKDHPELNELAKIYSMENWTEYHSKSGLSFQYPKIWDISENDGQIHIFTKDKSANIEIIVDGFSTSKEEYLKNQTDMHGMLVNQRYTRLPNADNVYAKIWNDPTPESTGSGVPKLQFYVFKPKNVIKLFVYPAEISLKVVLDSLMRSLKLTI